MGVAGVLAIWDRGTNRPVKALVSRPGGALPELQRDLAELAGFTGPYLPHRDEQVPVPGQRVSWNRAGTCVAWGSATAYLPAKGRSGAAVCTPPRRFEHDSIKG